MMPKALATLLRNYELQPVNLDEKLEVISVGVAAMSGAFPCHEGVT